MVNNKEQKANLENRKCWHWCEDSVARVRKLCGTGATILNVHARLMNVSARTLLSLNCLNLSNSSWFGFVCTKYLRDSEVCMLLFVYILSSI